MNTPKYLLIIWFISLNKSVHGASIWDYFSGQYANEPTVQKEETYSDLHDFYTNQDGSDDEDYEDDEDSPHPNSNIFYDYLQKGVKGIGSWLAPQYDDEEEESSSLPLAEPVVIEVTDAVPVDDDVQEAQEILSEDEEKDIKLLVNNDHVNNNDSEKAIPQSVYADDDDLVLDFGKIYEDNVGRYTGDIISEYDDSPMVQPISEDLAPIQVQEYMATCLDENGTEDRSEHITEDHSEHITEDHSEIDNEIKPVVSVASQEEQHPLPTLEQHAMQEHSQQEKALLPQQQDQSLLVRRRQKDKYNVTPIRFDNVVKATGPPLMIASVPVVKSDSDSIREVGLGNTKRFVLNPLREKQQQEKKSLNTKIALKSVHQDAATFMENLNSFDHRVTLKPVSTTCSPSYSSLLELLNGSLMQDIDFSSLSEQDASVPSTDPSVKLSAKKISTSKDDLITGFMGEMWNGMSASQLKNNSSARIQSLQQKLSEVAPKTMAHLPSLAPKKVYEKAVLEGWFVDGLLLAYPSLGNFNSNLSKSDAIALIILAILSKPIKETDNIPVITRLLGELNTYSGGSVDSFPLDLFKDPRAEQQAELIEKLFNVVIEKDLKYTGEAIKQILQKETNSIE